VGAQVAVVVQRRAGARSGSAARPRRWCSAASVPKSSRQAYSTSQRRRGLSRPSASSQAAMLWSARARMARVVAGHRHGQREGGLAVGAQGRAQGLDPGLPVGALGLVGGAGPLGGPEAGPPLAADEDPLLRREAELARRHPRRAGGVGGQEHAQVLEDGAHVQVLGVGQGRVVPAQREGRRRVCPRPARCRPAPRRARPARSLPSKPACRRRQMALRPATPPPTTQTAGRSRWPGAARGEGGAQPVAAGGAGGAEHPHRGRGRRALTAGEQAAEADPSGEAAQDRPARPAAHFFAIARQSSS
jgi:hypothetical protein